MHGALNPPDLTLHAQKSSRKGSGEPRKDGVPGLVAALMGGRFCCLPVGQACADPSGKLYCRASDSESWEVGGASASCLRPPSGTLERNCEEMTGLELWAALVSGAWLAACFGEGVGGSWSFASWSQDPWS